MLARLRKAGGKVAAGAERGLTEAADFLMRKSQEIVPVQTGNLKASYFIRKFGSGTRTDMVLGYTAKYAAYVHERLDLAHGAAFNVKHADEIAAAAGMKAGTAQGGMFNRSENQQAKFLERPARDNRGALLRIIANSAKV
jgi:hypothetical protein